MAIEHLNFAGHSGETLAGVLDLPNGPVLATALFAHCFTCSKSSLATKRISSRLAAAGIAVLRFDFTGLGQSSGDFKDTNFSTTVTDIHHAARALEARLSAPSLLIGHSLGGAAVIKAARDIDSVKAVATLAAPSHPAHVLHHLEPVMDEIRAEGEALVSLGGRDFTIKNHFLEDVEGISILDDLDSLKKALLILHSPTDQTVGIENASNIFMSARHPKSFVTLDNADHLITDRHDAEYAADVIKAWSARYLDLKAPAAPIGAPEGIVRSSEVSPDGFLQDVTSGPKHHIIVDEPIAFGGTNLGLTPFNLLSAALASCTSITLRMYAKRKKWAVEHISVDVVHDKLHASACEHCEMEDGRIDHFKRIITVKGDITSEQCEKLLQIADKCPVHRTLESKVMITTEKELNY